MILERVITKKRCTYLLKCALCGYAMCVPGLSGGSVAILLGVYKKMMETASGILKKPLQCLPSLVSTGVACILGAVLFALFPGRYAVSHERAFEIASAFIVAVSLPFFIRHSAIKKLTRKNTFLILAGATTVLLFELLMRLRLPFATDTVPAILYFPIGFVLSVSLVLPGISFPYMLSFIGVYGEVMEAVNSVDIQLLLFLGTGTAAGIVLLTRFILKIMERHPCGTDCVLLGFTAASAIAVLI